MMYNNFTFFKIGARLTIQNKVFLLMEDLSQFTILQPNNRSGSFSLLLNRMTNKFSRIRESIIQS